MTTDNVLSAGNVRGFVSLWRIDDVTGQHKLIFEQHNQIQHTWGCLAAKALGLRPDGLGPSYNISAVYFEYENVLTPETTVVEPQSFSKTLNIDYYNTISVTPNRDYLRVPIIVAPQFSTASGYAGLLPTNQQFNQLTFFAQTTGTSGMSGRSFGANVGGRASKIYAAALVAAPDLDDPTKDVVFSRTVFSADNQVIKDASAQIGITWSVAFI